jgi:hypothetical protein
MIYTKKDVQRLREQANLKISEEQESAILERFGVEPDDPHEWTEQDICEQVRKMLVSGVQEVSAKQE